MEHKKIPFKTPYKSFPKNPGTIRKIESPLKKN
jgi:hypothetical protein